MKRRTHGAMDVYPLGGVILLLREECEAFGGLRAWARAHKVSAPYVSRVLARKMPPAEKILDALGLEPSTVYVPKQAARRKARKI